MPQPQHPQSSLHARTPRASQAPSKPSPFPSTVLDSHLPAPQRPPARRHHLLAPETFLARHSSSLPGSEAESTAPFPKLMCAAVASAARQQGAVPQAQPVPSTAVPWPRDKQLRPGNELPQCLLPAVLRSGVLNNSGELLNCLENTSRSFLMSSLRTCHPRLEEQREMIPPATRRHRASTGHHCVPERCGVAGWRVPKFLGYACSTTSTSQQKGGGRAVSRLVESGAGAASVHAAEPRSASGSANARQAQTRQKWSLQQRTKPGATSPTGRWTLLAGAFKAKPYQHGLSLGAGSWILRVQLGAASLQHPFHPQSLTP